MRYDTVLKELFQQAPQRLLELMAGDTAREMLTVEYPSVRLRKPDLVVRLAGGGVFHLELQSGPQDDMLWRMLEYYVLIYRQFGQTPAQRVLYVGEEA
jgi:predicted transposase YdaD